MKHLNQKTRLGICLLLATLSGAHVYAGDRSWDSGFQNLATLAAISASSEHEHLPARAVADGRISEPGAALGEVGSWAVLGDKEKGRGEISFTWQQPTRVAEVVYFGRCAWQKEEVFKEYEIYVAGQSGPVAKGELQKVAGPQRIRFAPVTAARLTLKFLSSHGGSNPGANEIMIFSEPLTEEQLNRIVRFAPNTLFNDHVVLQQGQPIRIWGTAADGERVIVEFRGHTAESTTANGKWKVTVPPQKPGEPSEITIRSAAGKFVIRDVLVGEVWIASGQSNMEMPVDASYWPSRYDGVMNAKQEVASAEYPQIRMFYVPRRPPASLVMIRAGSGGFAVPRPWEGFRPLPTSSRTTAKRHQGAHRNG